MEFKIPAIFRAGIFLHLKKQSLLYLTNSNPFNATSL